MLLQLAVGAAVLFSLNRVSILLGIAVLGLIGDLSVHEAGHLLAAGLSRPQLQLGRAARLDRGDRARSAWPPLLLYLGGIFWTLGYDTIYAHQDKEDDALIGVKSSALALGARTRPLLFVFYAAAVAAVGRRRRAPPVSVRCSGPALAVAGAAAHLAGGARRYRRPGRLPRKVPLEPHRRLAGAGRDRRRTCPLSRPWTRPSSSAATPRSPRRRWCPRSGSIWRPRSPRSGRRPRRQPGAWRGAATVLGLRLGRRPGARPPSARSPADRRRPQRARFRLRLRPGRDRRRKSRRRAR